MLNTGQQQRERPQDKKPHTDQNPTPGFDQIEIESVDDILEELEELKRQNSKEERRGCECW